LDIVLARVEFKDCDDLRPCLVIYPFKSSIIGILPISSQPELFEAGYHFWIEKAHPDYRATGLTKRSYVLDNKIYDLEMTDVKKRLGRLDGDLAKEFKDWYGIE
jgi:hypothetical protein